MSRAEAIDPSELDEVLRKSGLLILEKRGRFWFYRADPDRLAAAAAAIRSLAD